jgi:hypothetical protein
MLKSLLYRYRIVAGLFLIVILLATLPRLSVRAEESTTPPAKVIVEQAIVIDRGVKITWLAGQPGTYPLSGYYIERKTLGSNFNSIGHVQSTSNTSYDFVDISGRTGDIYQVIAEDNQHPTSTSNSSEMTAGPVRAGDSAVLVTRPAQALSTQVLGSQTFVTDEKSATLQSLLVKEFSDFDVAVSGNKTFLAEDILNFIQDYQRQTLLLFPSLSTARKSSLIRTCLDQTRFLEADLALLPESDQLNGMLVQAGCQSMQDATQ